MDVSFSGGLSYQKNTNLPLVTDKLNHACLHQVHLATAGKFSQMIT